MTTSRAFAVSIALVLVALAPAARADDTEATRHFDAGAALYKQGRFAEAEVEFQQAWDAKHTFDVAANLGDCEIEVGQFRAAAEHLAYALKELPLSTKDEIKRRLAERFARARAEVGTLRLHVTPKEANVTVNGRAVSAPQDEVFVDAGAVTVEATYAGRAPGRAELVAKKGQAAEVTLDLAAAPVDVAPPPSKSNALLVTGVAISVAGLATGLVFTIVSNGKASDADKLLTQIQAAHPGVSSPCAMPSTSCSSLQSFNHDADTFDHLAVGTFVGTGIVAAATLAYALYPTRSAAPATGPSLEPAVGPTFAGGFLRSNF